MYLDEEHIANLLERESKEQLKQEYDIINALLEFDDITDSVFIEYLDIVEAALMKECAKRYFKDPLCEVVSFPLKLIK